MFPLQANNSGWQPCLRHIWATSWTPSLPACLSFSPVVGMGKRKTALRVVVHIAPILSVSTLRGFILSNLRMRKLWLLRGAIHHPHKVLGRGKHGAHTRMWLWERYYLRPGRGRSFDPAMTAGEERDVMPVAVSCSQGSVSGCGGRVERHGRGRACWFMSSSTEASSVW